MTVYPRRLQPWQWPLREPRILRDAYSAVGRNRRTLLPPTRNLKWQQLRSVACWYIAIRRRCNSDIHLTLSSLYSSCAARFNAATNLLPSHTPATRAAGGRPVYHVTGFKHVSVRSITSMPSYTNTITYCSNLYQNWDNKGLREFVFWDYKVVQSCKGLPTFRRHVLHPPSSSNTTPSKKTKNGRDVSPNRLLTSTGLQNRKLYFQYIIMVIIYSTKNTKTRR
jgi:hypothetical protein